jgi:transposase InsO family protein
LSRINICGTIYFLCNILDGYSRFVIHWAIRRTMKEFEVETIMQHGRERFPGERPRIISDNGPQLIAKDFKELIRVRGMTHVRTSFYYPRSNRKMERWYKTLKGKSIRVKTPLGLEDARRVVADFVAHYNQIRLHSAIGYVARADKLAGRELPLPPHLLAVKSDAWDSRSNATIAPSASPAGFEAAGDRFRSTVTPFASEQLSRMAAPAKCSTLEFENLISASVS